ncbi:anti-sigma factor [Yoonia sp.]|uniref:anti-sigma factor n=1 Tax=Yoonia sp. TaxID=2212373 RepID=UPI002FD9403B
MTQPEDDLPEEDLLAGEFALGLLTGDALRDAQRRSATDPDFAAAVARWDAQFAGMTDALAPVAPRPAVKAALMARLFPPAQKTGLWQRLWLWQAATVAALVLLAVVMLRDPVVPPQQGPLYTAELVSAEGDFRVLAVVDKTTNEVVLTRTAGAAPEGRILQVWASGPGEPVMSVGLWPEGETVRLALPPTIAAVEGALTLGVSEEPPGGSPTGAPTGRIFGLVEIADVRPAL